VELSWSRLNEARKAVRARWPGIRSLRVVGRSTRYAAARIRPGERVLDIGASEGRFGRRLAPGVEYRTLDADPEVQVDYRRIADVASTSFDVVTCFETIEHLTLEEAWAMLEGAARVLRPEGRLFVSTPNVHHPWSYLRSATHKTPFCYDELGGLIECTGFVVDGLFRCHRDAVLKSVARKLAAPLYRLVGVDYAKSILAVAHRRDDSTRPAN